ncbi:MAG: amidohydrolase [Draconibacterium sp.]|nr:amidohydrolase [Draconibacterium sp.]
MKIKRLMLPGVFFSMLVILSSCTGKKTLRFEDFPKIDAHVHINTDNVAVMETALALNFKFLTIAVGSGKQENIDKQLNFAKKMQDLYPNELAYTSTFSMENFEKPGWQENVIARLKKDFEGGAIAVKVWKDIGMTFRDSLGNFIMIDDPRFDPIFDFIAENGKTLVAHIGEPKNCWLPLDSMTVINDKKYYAEHPQYHMYLHPDYPSYKRQIEARDNVLEKHPDLTLVGAHLGSLEWNVTELAKHLDRFPNFAVDMAARVCHFQVQDRQKVIDFIKKYQDRLLYATDLVVNNNMDNEKRIARLEDEWRSDWNYFTTNDEMNSPNVEGSFQGIGLSKDVLKKIYHDNAIKWYPGSFEQ